MTQPQNPQQPYYPEQPQQPYQQGDPYQPYGYPTYPQQPYQPQVASTQQPYPQQPYQPQQPYPYPYPYTPTPEPPKKKKAWPWVLGGCLALLLLFGIPGCAGCVMMAGTVGSLMANGNSIDILDSNSEDSYRDYLYDLYHGDGSTSSTSSSDPYLYQQLQAQASSLDEIAALLETRKGAARGGQMSPGYYLVGQFVDIEPGLYYLGGSQTDINRFYVFKPSSESSLYELSHGEPFLGNYFVELEEGDLLVYLAPENLDVHMVPADEAPAVSAPYLSGLYRVGTDLPAGTYTATLYPEALGASDAIDPTLWVMSGLDYYDTSEILDERAFMAGSKHTVTLEEGQWVELYGVQMVPVE